MTPLEVRTGLFTANRTYCRKPQINTIQKSMDRGDHNHSGNTCSKATASMAQETSQKGIGVERLGGMRRSAVLWMEHGCCVHELGAVDMHKTKPGLIPL